MVCLLGRCPKYRRKVIGGRADQRLKEIIAKAVDKKGAWFDSETMLDHAHLLVEVDPRFRVHELSEDHLLREKFPGCTSSRHGGWCAVVGARTLRRDAEGPPCGTPVWSGAMSIAGGCGRIMGPGLTSGPRTRLSTCG